MPVLTLAQSAQSFGIWGEDWTNENTVGRKEDCRNCPPLFNSILFITSLHPRRSQKKKNNSTNTTMISSLWDTRSGSSDSASCPERVPPAIGGPGWKPESSLMSAVLSCPTSRCCNSEFYYFSLCLHLHPSAGHPGFLFWLPWRCSDSSHHCYTYSPPPVRSPHTDQRDSFHTWDYAQVIPCSKLSPFRIKSKVFTEA